MQLKQPQGTKYIRFVLAYEKPIAVFLREDRDIMNYNLVKEQLYALDMPGFRRWCASHGLHHQLIEDKTNEEIRQMISCTTKY